MWNQKWKKVWNNNASKIKKINLSNVITANGYNSTKLGLFSEEKWINSLADIEKKYSLSKGTILEYGCGAGAVLTYFENKNYQTFGIDYSSKLIDIAGKFLKKTKLKTGEYDLIKEFKIKFDYIVSNGVFMYFDSTEYAEKVLNEMIKNSANKSKILILDIPDLNKKEKYSEEMIKKLGEDQFIERYKDLKHMFYAKSFFAEYAKKNNLQISIEDQNIQDYENSKYRFNVCLSKQ